MRLRPDLALPLGAAAAAFVLYAVTLSPGLAGGDAGELTLAASRFAVAHPPGYPLFVLLGHAASWLPLGEPALRLNLLSALCGAAAAGFLAAAVLRLTRSKAGALLAAGLFALAPLPWIWSTRTDVFALGNAAAAALLWVAALHATSPSPRTLAAGGGLIGLGLCNHHTLVLLALPISVWAVARVWNQPWRNRALAAAAAAALAGLLPYAVLPLAALHSPEHSWGEATTLGGLWAILSRAEYGSLQLAATSSSSAIPGGLRLFAKESLRAALFVGWIPALLALRGAPKAPAGLSRAVAVGWVLSGPVFIAIARLPLLDALHEQTLARFFLLPQLLLSFLVGVGSAGLLAPRSTRIALTVAGALLALQGGWTLAVRERPEHSLAERWAESLLRPLPPGAVVLVRGDVLSNALTYVHSVGRAPPEVEVLNLDLLTQSWFVRSRVGTLRFPADRYLPGAPDGFSLAQLTQANPGRTFFVVGELKPGDPSNEQFRLRPEGLVQHLVRAGDPAAPTSSAVAPAVPEARVPNDAWDAAILEEYWEARHRPVLEALRAAIAEGASPLTYGQLALELEALVKEHPSAPAAWFKNLGIAHGRAGNAPAMKAALREYLERAPNAADRAQVLEHLRS